MDKIRVASIGLGWWGGVLAAAARRSGAVEVAQCFARTPASREEFAKEHGCVPADSLDAILADPLIDALVIATPHSQHREMIEAAGAAGKHVFVEKPLALTVADADASIEAARRGGVVLQVGHHRRRQIANRRLRERIDAQSLGTIHLLESTVHVPKYQTPTPGWRADPAETPVGGMTALGVHTIDTFHYLAGPIARVTAGSKRILKHWANDDVSVIGFEFEAGPLGYLGTSLVLPRRCDVAVYGSQAAAWSEEDGTRFFTQDKTETSRREEPVEEFDELADQMGEFARCVRDGVGPEAGGAEARDVVAVLEAIIAAAESGRWVDVADYR